MQEEDEYVVKVVLCGDSGVGKTSLALRYAQHSFCATEKPTIGVGIYVQTHRAYRFQIWDTSGQERFKSMLSTWFQGANVLCFIYNTNARATFNSVPLWLAKARWAPREAGPDAPWVCHGNESAIGVLIGTQVDRVTYREVDQDAAQQFALDHNLLWAETSALTAQGIEPCFAAIAECLDKITLSKPVATYLPGAEEWVDDPLLAAKKEKKKACCCCFL